MLTTVQRLVAKRQFHKQINMPKRKLKPKASGQWKLYQSTNRKSVLLLTKDRNIEGGNYEHHPKETPQKA